MRRFCIPLCVFLICAFLRSGFSVEALSFKNSNTQLSVSSGGVFLSARGGEQLMVKELMYGAAKNRYTLTNKIFASCVYKSDVYALTQSPSQSGVCILTRMRGGKIIDELCFENLRLAQSTALAVTKNYFYVVNSNEHIDVFDRKGNKIHTSSFIAYDLLAYNGGVLCAGNKSVRLLAGSKESTVLSSAVKGTFYGVYDDMLCDTHGNIYRLGQGKVFSTDSVGLYKICVTDNSVLCLNSGKIDRYSKSGDYLSSAELSAAPAWIAYCNNKVLTISPSGSDIDYTVDSEKKLFPGNSAPAQGSDASASKVQLPGWLEYDDKYIYLDVKMTVSAVKKAYASDDFEIEFTNKKSGYFGTNTKVKFVKGKTVFEYKIVVSGDLTGEGNVNINDKRAMFKHLLKVEKLKGAFRKAADLNGDKRISNSDLVLLARNIKLQ